MRIFVAGRLIQRTFETEAQKRTTIEVVAAQVAPDLRFQSAEVGSAAATPAEEKQNA